MISTFKDANNVVHVQNEPEDEFKQLDPGPQGHFEVTSYPVDQEVKLNMDRDTLARHICRAFYRVLPPDEWKQVSAGTRTKCERTAETILFEINGEG